MKAWTPPNSMTGAPAPLSLQTEADRLIALYQRGELSEVVARCERLRPRFPAAAVLDNILGAAALGLGDFVRAQIAFARAAAADPNDAEIRNNLGIAFAALGRLDEARAAYARALAIRPDFADAHYNLGNAQRRAKDHAGAITSYERALELRSDHAASLNNLGLVLQECGRLDDAFAACARAAELDPNCADAHYNLGNIERDRQSLEPAIEHYRRALAIRPDHVDGWNNLGLACRESGRIADAAACYGRALAIRPDAVEALHNLGNLLMETKDYPGAIKAYGLALAIRPEKAEARAQKLHAQAHVCDFSAYDEYAACNPATDLAPGLVPPFTMLGFADDPEVQIGYARAWQERWPAANIPAAAREEGERIRIGYFSADFHDHATLHLMAGLVREHDRTRFEITAYSYGPDSRDEMRNTLIASVERFVDVGDMADADVAQLARSHGLDIAVDLKGYTQQSRSRIFAHRPAPVQVNYLGYPGSMGAEFIDYFVADVITVPEGAERGYSEKIVRLPHCYQPNDDRRRIAESAAGRSDHGLPDRGFVFCCFNHSYKISPREFAIWMRLLGGVEGSVLWLLRSNEWAEANLRREAAARGVDPGRLVFAANLPQAEHLGRLRHADLFLDTFAINAHTTASDALWAGLPVLTKIGRQFAARVGASLVHAVGLPELAVETEAAYEARAIELATTPALLGDLRARLAANRLSLPLFDTLAYTRALEAAYAAMHERRLAGLAPAHIRV